MIMNKLLAKVMAVILLITCITIPVLAATVTKSGIEVTLETDKEAYDIGDEIAVSVIVRNTGDTTVNDVTVDLEIPEGVKLAKGTSTRIAIGTLAKGEERKQEIRAEAIAEVKNNILDGNVNTGDRTSGNILFVILLSATAVIVLFAVRGKKESILIKGAVIVLAITGVLVSTRLELAASTGNFEVKKTIMVGGEEKEIVAVIKYEEESVASGEAENTTEEATTGDEITPSKPETDGSEESTEPSEQGVSWRIEGDTLYIYGNGPMEDYSVNNDKDERPWSEEINNIKTIIVDKGVTNIGSHAFSDCSSLTNIEIPNSVTGIEIGAFSGCSSLTGIEIPNGVTSIGSFAFAYCSDLADIEIPNSVTSIGAYVFLECGSLTGIEIPNSVTSIGDGAFADCSGLIGNIKIPNNVTSIGESTFAGCSGLISIELPNNVTSIGESTFAGCSGLISIELPNSVTSIGDYAFAGCSGLISIELPNSVTGIGNYAFSGCSSLTDIEIPNSVTSIGNYAFSGCRSLYDMEIPSSVTSIGTGAFDVSWRIEDDTLYIYYINGGPINSVPLAEEKNNIKTIIVAEGVTSIGSGVFDGWSSLISVELPNSVTSIGDSAFRGCSSLTSIKMPNVTWLGEGAFWYCSSLTSMELPSSEPEFGGKGPFNGCDNITTIYGEAGSWAEQYATENGYEFIAK